MNRDDCTIIVRCHTCERGVQVWDIDPEHHNIPPEAFCCFHCWHYFCDRCAKEHFGTTDALQRRVDKAETQVEVLSAANCEYRTQIRELNRQLKNSHDKVLADLVRSLHTHTTDKGDRGCIISSADISEHLIAACRACNMFAVDENGFGYGLVKKHPLAAQFHLKEEYTES